MNCNSICIDHCHITIVKGPTDDVSLPSVKRTVHDSCASIYSRERKMQHNTMSTDNASHLASKEGTFPIRC
jgi:hypothetical protein